MATKNIGKNVTSWDTLEQDSMSYHKYILCQVKENIPVGKEERKIKFLDAERFCTEIKNIAQLYKPTHQGLTDLIITAQKKATTTTKRKRNQQPYWWTNEIAQERSNCTAARRAITRCRAKPGDYHQNLAIQLELSHKNLKKNLKKLVEASKREQWRVLCQKLNEDIWGDGYQIAVKHVSCPRLPCDIDKNTKIGITRDLFPVTGDRCPARRDRVENPPQFTMEELKEAGKKSSPARHQEEIKSCLPR